MKLPDNFDISKYAEEYCKNKTFKGRDDRIEEIVPTVKERGYLTNFDLKEVSRWKVRTGRNTLRNIKQNSDIFIEETTRIALNIDITKRERISSLCCLQGVNLPMASTILHWFHQDRYPVWDERALKTVQLDRSQYKNDFERWEAYVSFCRKVAEENGVCMRTLDRALWKFSKNKETRSGKQVG